MKIGHNDRERAMVITMPITTDYGVLEAVSKNDGNAVYRSVDGTQELTDSITRKGGKVRRLTKLVFAVGWIGGDGVEHQSKRQIHIVDMYDDPREAAAEASVFDDNAVVPAVTSLVSVFLAAPLTGDVLMNMKRAHAGLGPQEGNYSGIVKVDTTPA